MGEEGGRDGTKWQEEQSNSECVSVNRKCAKAGSEGEGMREDFSRVRKPSPSSHLRLLPLEHARKIQSSTGSFLFPAHSLRD